MHKETCKQDPSYEAGRKLYFITRDLVRAPKRGGTKREANHVIALSVCTACVRRREESPGEVVYAAEMV